MNESQQGTKRSARTPGSRVRRLVSVRSWSTRTWIVFVVIAHIVGAISSIRAVMSTRTPQGAIAWAISLNTIPYVAVPAFWVFGQSTFDGYEHLRHSEMVAERETQQEVMRMLRDQAMLFEPETNRDHLQKTLLERLAKMPVTRYNDADLLIDGEATFQAIFERIATAEDYILVEFYIIRPDALGNRLKDALIDRAKEGVRVYVLYDALGSIDLKDEYLQELEDAGVETASFSTTRGWRNRTRLNFRNHRKIVVIDGKEAFVGGHNVGDEYLGKDPTLTPWRDTHVAVRGPVVLEAQATFVEDWKWATGETPALRWIPEPAPEGDVLALCLPTGPADPFETGTLLMLDMVNTARKRIWIASPYFVPDAQLVAALQLAALRGVDVRVLLPESSDDWLVDLTSYSYLEDAEKADIKVYRYQSGFMHQKVFVIDDDSTAIGTANFDNRSMRLNFEVMLLTHDREFAREVQDMLLADFARSRLATARDYTDKSAPFRFFVRAARLLAPIQ